MGTNYYKIGPEIREFIIEKAKAHPELGCRKISSLILAELKSDISKSSIGAIIKTEGLNKAVGRRRIHPALLVSPFVKRADQKGGASKTEILAIKFILEDNSIFFLDAGCHSVWPTQHIPETFSVGLAKLKNYLLDSVLAAKQPLILQAASGFEAPSPAFLNFLAGFQAEDPAKTIKRMELYARNKELLEALEPIEKKKRLFILGLWPWQYKNREAGYFSTLSSMAYKRANLEVLTIITNMEKDPEDSDRPIKLYLERWPNLELGYQDFLDKIKKR